MYGNGGFHLPIIDIVQTINSSSYYVTKSLKPNKPVISYSNKGFCSSKKEKGSTKNADHQLRTLYSVDKRSTSFHSFNKETFSKENEKRNLNKRTILPEKMKILKYRPNWTHNESRSSERISVKENENVNEKKSFQVLFKATKNINSFEKDETEEEEILCSGPKKYTNSSFELKRKRSFVDYIKIKRRRRN